MPDQPRDLSAANRRKLIPWRGCLSLLLMVAAAVITRPWSWSEPWYVVSVVVWGVWLGVSVITLLIGHG